MKRRDEKGDGSERTRRTRRASPPEEGKAPPALKEKPDVELGSLLRC